MTGPLPDDVKGDGSVAFVAMVVADHGVDFGHMDWGGGGWWMMLFWGPVLVIALFGLVIWAVRSTTGGESGSAAAGEDPLDGARRILAERYARGELDSEEYQERFERLG